MREKSVGVYNSSRPDVFVSSSTSLNIFDEGVKLAKSSVSFSKKIENGGTFAHNFSESNIPEISIGATVNGDVLDSDFDNCPGYRENGDYYTVSRINKNSGVAISSRKQYKVGDASNHASVKSTTELHSLSPEYPERLNIGIKFAECISGVWKVTKPFDERKSVKEVSADIQSQYEEEIKSRASTKLNGRE